MLIAAIISCCLINIVDLQFNQKQEPIEKIETPPPAEENEEEQTGWGATAISINGGPWQYTYDGKIVTKEEYDNYLFNWDLKKVDEHGNVICYYIKTDDRNWTRLSFPEPADAKMTVNCYGP